MKELLAFLVEIGTEYGLKLLFALIVLAVGLKAASLFVRRISKSKAFERLDDTLRRFLLSFISISLKILVTITSALILGIPAASFVTMLASCGVAIGLALQGSLSNFAGGIMLLFFKPFKDGDYIEVNGVSGTVREIGTFYTVLTTPTNEKIVLPNGTLTNSSIKNYSAECVRRVDFTFSASYDASPEKVKEILKGIVQSHPCALKDPAPFVALSKYSESSLDYTVRVWAKSSDYWKLYFDVNEKVKESFDMSGIEIPYPQIDVHTGK